MMVAHQAITATATAADARAARPDVAAWARRLLPRAHVAFQTVPASARGAMVIALDHFIAAPAPATFLAAVRVLDQTSRAAILERAGGGLMRRSFEEGVTALRRVASLPQSLVDALATNLPLDARAGDRLRALSALAAAHQEIGGRVVADIERRRRLWKTLPRRPRPPVFIKRK